MNIEEAKEVLKCCMNDNCTKCEYADVFDCVKKHNEAIETVLSELEKKDSIINLMAEDLYGLAISINEEYRVEEFLLNKETIKEHYLNRKEE